LIPTGYIIGKKSKLIQTYYNEKLKELCDNHYSKNKDILAPTILATKLRNEFGTITIPKFHLHMKNGIMKSKQMSLNCLDIVLKGLTDYNIYSSQEILKFPNGKINTNIFDLIRIKMLNCFYFGFLTFFKRIKVNIHKLLNKITSN
jgi:hypothetical protein